MKGNKKRSTWSSLSLQTAGTTPFLFIRQCLQDQMSLSRAPASPGPDVTVLSGAFGKNRAPHIQMLQACLERSLAPALSNYLNSSTKLSGEALGKYGGEGVRPHSRAGAVAALGELGARLQATVGSTNLRVQVSRPGLHSIRSRGTMQLLLLQSSCSFKIPPKTVRTPPPLYFLHQECPASSPLAESGARPTSPGSAPARSGTGAPKSSGSQQQV